MEGNKKSFLDVMFDYGLFFGFMIVLMIGCHGNKHPWWK